MNTYEVFSYIGMGLWGWLEVTGNSPQEAVDTFRQHFHTTVLAMRYAVSKESVEDWE